MKTTDEIEKARRELIALAHGHATDHGFSFSGTCLSHENMHFFAMGAIAFSSFVLERETADNFHKMIDAFKADRGSRQKGCEDATN